MPLLVSSHVELENRLTLVRFFMNRPGGDQEKIPGTYGGVGGWSTCQFWDFFRLILGIFSTTFCAISTLF